MQLRNNMQCFIVKNHLVVFPETKTEFYEYIAFACDKKDNIPVVIDTYLIKQLRGNHYLKLVVDNTAE